METLCAIRIIGFYTFQPLLVSDCAHAHGIQLFQLTLLDIKVNAFAGRPKACRMGRIKLVANR